jgi:hypothetical protein
MKKIVIVLVVVIACGAILLITADRSFYRSFVKQSREVKATAGAQAAEVITEKDLEGLPEPIARYMRFSRVIGKKRISFLHVIHSGTFRTGAQRPFMPIRGEYYLTTRRPSFLWYAKLSMAPGMSVAAFDSYFNGKGRMLVKVLSLFTVVNAQSPETDNSAFGRCVAEMAMAPTFFLDREMVRWEMTGKNSARCTVTDAGFSTNVEIFVNPDGSLAKTVVMRYYDRGNGTSTLEKFTGVTPEYKEQAGFMLPAKLDGYWNLKEGDLHYVSFSMDTYEIE